MGDTVAPVPARVESAPAPSSDIASGVSSSVSSVVPNTPQQVTEVTPTVREVASEKHETKSENTNASSGQQTKKEEDDQNTNNNQGDQRPIIELLEKLMNIIKDVLSGKVFRTEEEVYQIVETIKNMRKDNVDAWMKAHSNVNNKK